MEMEYRRKEDDKFPLSQLHIWICWGGSISLDKLKDSEVPKEVAALPENF